jgi:regulatory protein
VNSRLQLQTILARRDHSVAETEAKLRRQGFSTAEIAATITWAKDHRYLDDARFAENFITSTLRRKPVGRRYLAFKLRAKGLAPNLISSSLQTLLPPAREAELARTAAQRWQKLHPDHAHDRTRLTRFLASRGFTTTDGVF